MDTIARQCFGGVLPPFPEVIIENVVKVACVDADEATAQRFADELYVALHERLEAQACVETAGFKN